MREQGESGRPALRDLRTSPTGRVPQWVIDEAAGRGEPTEPWRSGAPSRSHRDARRRHNWTMLRGAVLVVAVVALGVVGVRLGLLPDVPSTAAGTLSGEPTEPDWPTPGFDSEDEPLGIPTAAPAGSGAYDFVQRQDDGVTPVAYDPCRPVHYVIRQANAPDGGDRLVQDAVARISEVTGLRFVYDGITGEAPSDPRELFQPDLYGDRWAPVLIAWDTVAEEADLASDVAGLGGSAAVSAGDGPQVYVTGTVQLDAAQFVEILARADGEGIAHAIVLHELAHVLGLAHVSDPAQLMYPSQSGVLDFAAGDLTGLVQLGSGACFPSV